MVNGMYMCFICLHLYSVYHGDMCGMYNVGCVWVCVCVYLWLGQCLFVVSGTHV